MPARLASYHVNYNFVCKWLHCVDLVSMKCAFIVRTHMCGICHMPQSQQSDMRPSAREYREKCNYLFRINGFPNWPFGLRVFNAHLHSIHCTMYIYDRLKSARNSRWKKKLNCRLRESEPDSFNSIFFHDCIHWFYENNLNASLHF